jgi:hypothetical protein
VIQQKIQSVRLPFVDEIEIEFVTDDHAQPINNSLIADRGDAPSPLLFLFQDSWDYPSRIAINASYRTILLQYLRRGIVGEPISIF